MWGFGVTVVWCCGVDVRVCLGEFWGGRVGVSVSVKFSVSVKVRVSVFLCVGGQCLGYG